MRLLLSFVLLACTATSQYTSTFNLTHPNAYCADRMEMVDANANSFVTVYDPLESKYTNQTMVLDKSQASLTAPNQVNLQYFDFKLPQANTTVTGDGVQSYPSYGRQNIPDLRYLYLPYKSQNSSWTMDFLIPVTSAQSNISCSNITDLLTKINLTMLGWVTVNATDKNNKVYIPNQPINCSPQQLSQAGLADANNRPANLTSINNRKIDALVTNCLYPGMDRSQMFINGIAWNWAFWLFWLSILFVAGYGSWVDNDMIWESGYKDDWRTNFGPYSIHHTSSESFTKISRMVQMCVAFAAIVFFNAIFVYTNPWMHLAIRLIVIPICSVIFAIPFTLLSGYFLYKAYEPNNILIEDFSRAQSVEERLMARDRWERAQFQAFYRFYIVAIALCLAFGIGAIPLLHLHPVQLQGWWLLAVVISMILQFFLVDFLISFLSRSIGLVSKLAHMRGYYFDYETQHAIHELHLE